MEPVAEGRLLLPVSGRQGSGKSVQILGDAMVIEQARSFVGYKHHPGKTEQPGRSQGGKFTLRDLGLHIPFPVNEGQAADIFVSNLGWDVPLQLGRRKALQKRAYNLHDRRRRWHMADDVVPEFDPMQDRLISSSECFVADPWRTEGIDRFPATAAWGPSAMFPSILLLGVRK